jgi:vacuolar-type H+-ATPase subunit C/Vma6
VLNPRYAFISAFLKGEETKTVTSEHVDRMATASNLQDALAIIRETDIGSYLEELPVRTFDDIDEYLWGYLRQRISYVESLKFLPKEVLKLSRAYMVEYDVLNIKAALQGISTGKKARMIPIGIVYNNGLLDELFNAENIDDIIHLLIKCQLGDYVPALEQYKIDKSTKSKLIAETKLDSKYYENMLNGSKTIRDGDVLSRTLGLTIDLTNLQIISRAIIGGIGAEIAEYAITGGYMIVGQLIKDLSSSELAEVPTKLEGTPYQDIVKEVLSRYEVTKSVAVVNEIIDKHKFRLVKELLSLRVLSPLVMAWYIVLKEVEIRNLRLVLKAILDGVPVQEVKNYLVL